MSALADDTYNQGVLLYQQDRKPEALAAFEEALRLTPDHLPAMANRAQTLSQLGRDAEAAEGYAVALALAPGHPALLRGLGEALYALGRYGEAAAVFEQLTLALPDDADAWSKCGAALEGLGQLDRSLAAFDRSETLDPTDPATPFNRGNVLRDLLRFDEALAAYDQAVTLGNAIDAPIMKAQLLLLRGRFEEGLPLYEARWLSPQAGAGQRLDPALWNGFGQLTGKHVLLSAEQGYGDTLQMLRYAPRLAEAGARVTLQVQRPLLALARMVRGAEAVIASDEPAPAADVVCPIMSLPLLFGTRADAIPWDGPYLEAPTGRVAAWAERLGPKARTRIGLVWSGNAAHLNDRNRSLSLARLGPILSAGAEVISLQTDYRPGDAQALAAAGVRDVSSDLKDFAETAALIETLDLVIAVDTAVAHLAGALGKPVWILLPAAPDFRWGLGTAETPWYPSARLYRQPAPGAWEPAIAEAARDLGQWAERR